MYHSALLDQNNELAEEYANLTEPMLLLRDTASWQMF